MKVLLVNPPDENIVSLAPNPNGNGKSFIEPADYGAFPPLGLLYIAAYLEKHSPHHEIQIIDCVGEKCSHADLVDKVSDFAPDVVGVTSFTVSLIDVVMVAKLAKRLNPSVFTVLGGHHPIAFPFESASLDAFDCIVCGEGEHVFADLINKLESGSDFTDIVGVYTEESIEEHRGVEFRDKRLLHNVAIPSAYVEDIDSLPIPSRKHVRHISYHSTVGVSDNLATIISSRGCPYRCTFCDVPYKKYRDRSIQLVVDELEECLKLGYDEFHFYDDLFNIKAQKIHDFCDELEKRNLNITWDFRGRVNAVTRESLEHAKRTGLRQISFGVETGSDEGLKFLRKGSRTEKYFDAFRWCRELGIKTVADFIIGFPFEKTPKDIQENIDYVIKLDPDYMLLNILMLLPGTEIYDQGIAAGQVDPDKWSKFAGNPTSDFNYDYWTEHMSPEQLIKLRVKHLKRFYLRPRYIFRTALNVDGLQQFKVLFRGFLTILGLPARSLFRRIPKADPQRELRQQV